MKKKVSYIALIICTLAVALFWDNDIARTLLSFELLLVPCLFILSVYLERNLSASLVVPYRYVPFVSQQDFKQGECLYARCLCYAGLRFFALLLPAYRLLRQAVFQYRKGRSEGLSEPLYARVQRFGA